MILVQAAAEGFDLGKLLGTGGPVAAVGIILGYLSKIWFDSRKENRADKLTDRQSESGIVETTAAAIKLVRDQMIAMGQDITTLNARIVELQKDNAVLTSRVTDRDAQIEKLNERVGVLEAENEQLRRGR
jgi:chromosome segregation ATPase